MGASCSSQMDEPLDVEKKQQMVQLFRSMRGYGQTRYIQRQCPISESNQK